jgi:hypothetical protein
MTAKPRRGWKRVHGAGIERYRFVLGNGRMLMVVRHSPRKWYYGEMAHVRGTFWSPAGKETNMRKAMMKALLMVGQWQAEQEGMTDEDAWMGS